MTPKKTTTHHCAPWSWLHHVPISDPNPLGPDANNSHLGDFKPFEKYESKIWNHHLAIHISRCRRNVPRLASTEQPSSKQSWIAKVVAFKQRWIHFIAIRGHWKLMDFLRVFSVPNNKYMMFYLYCALWWIFFLSLFWSCWGIYIYINSYIMICFVTYWTARFLSHFHAWNLEVPRNSRGASQPASLASNMGSGICRDFTRVPSRLRFTCQVWLRWKPHKNIWWQQQENTGKETKNGWKDSKMDKKAHASVKASPSSMQFYNI